MKTSEKRRVSSGSKPVPITRPLLGREEIEAVTAVIESGWIAQGQQVARFEREFADTVGVSHAVAVSSGTTALHLALLAAGLGRGDLVIVPSFTFVATANAVEYTGAASIFVDIDFQTFNICPISIRACLEGMDSQTRARVRAILPVSQFGLCSDMAAVGEVAREYSLKVIEDAACGLGARRQGNQAGTEASLSSFSFHPRKIITTGEGGMIVTNDAEADQRMRQWRNHGASLEISTDKVDKVSPLMPSYSEIGYNYRLTDIQAAIGLVQLTRLEGILRERRMAATKYDELLQEVKEIRVPHVPEGYSHAYQSYVCIYGDKEIIEGKSDVDFMPDLHRLSVERNVIAHELEAAGIGVRQGTHAIHSLGYYSEKYNLEASSLPCSLAADRLSIALPLFPGITGDQQERVVATLAERIEQVRR